MSSSSSSSSSSLVPIWDVFLSFHGKDTRHNFTAHLYFALHQSGIRTYRDDSELERGQQISSGLLKAIRDSKASLVVLSNNYARSSWCLDELVEILACMKTKGLIVRPVFYHVDPSNVRYQKDSFGEALASHMKYHSVDKIEKWRAALTEISHLYGYHIGKDANVNESENIQMILKDVASLVSTKAKHLEEHLVGIDSSVEEIYEKLSMHSNDVRAIGICGMGGIGKTTIAKAFYNKYYDKFNSSCFVENVKRTLQAPDNLLSLLNQLLVQLLIIKDYIVVDVESGIRKLNDIFSSQKVLIVLDDFDLSDDLEFIIRRCNLFSPESRIIMTTRDTNLLSRLGIDIYMVKKLGENESLELFSYHTFRKTVPLNDYRYLSERFVDYVDGLPLALKVLGSYLRGKKVSFWKANLERVIKDPEDKIYNILRLSYDELSDTVKDIFLDIVFFFVGKDKDEAVWVFESCGFIPDEGIPILLERCLLTDENNELKMHNLIQNMGWKVIHQESQESGKRKRLVFRENAFDLFKYQEGMDKVEGLILDLTSWTQRDLSPNIFETMPKLRLLEIVNAPDYLKISFKNSFQELRCIHWHHCPWTRLPSSFRPQKLVILDMQFSNFRTIWKGSLHLMNLRSINVSWSKRLKTIPNFEKVKRLEKLSLRCCENLLTLDKTLVQLSKLSNLDLGKCRNLKKLPERIGQLDGLRNLDLGGCHVLKGLPNSIGQLIWLSELCLGQCYNLIQLPEEIGNMKGLKRLDASGTNIELLPDSVCQLSHLDKLNLRECKKLRTLPEQIGNMKGLKRLDASGTNIEQLPDSICQLCHLDDLDLYGCKKLRTLPEQIGNMKSLMGFYARGSAIRQLPDSFEDLINLAYLNLGYCRNLERLPGQLGKMKRLVSLDACNTAIEEVPDSIAQLTSLYALELNGCEKLGEIPRGIWSLTSMEHLELENWKSVECLPDSVKNMKGLEHLRVSCNIRSCLPKILCLTSLRRLRLRDTGESFSSSTKPFSLSNLSNLLVLKLEDCRSLGSCLPELPLNLKELHVERYESLEELPDLSTFLNLKTLWISECKNLQSLPPLPPHLYTLEIHDCRSLRDTHDHLTTLKVLDDLKITKCNDLIFNAEKSFFEEFDSSCFVKNVKRTLKGHNSLLSLINQLLAPLLNMKDYSAVGVEFGIRKLKEIFSSRKVLVVLDDIDESKDLEMVIRRCNSFVPGSTIIVTTRDQDLPYQLRIDKYKVNKLGKNESLELFSYHAFGTTIPPENFKNLLKSFVEYADGLPLALKVLGSSLKRREMPIWKEKLEKVKKIPVNEINQILRLSYDELPDMTVKDIFLDIIFFFVGKGEEEAVWVFESCGFFPNTGIQILLDRCLLTIENKTFDMHNLIQEMGWKVIQQESRELGNGKRLVCRENAFHMFKYQEGTHKIEGLILDLTSWTQRDLSPNIFEMMPKLRLLEIVNAPDDLKISFENSFQELRCIRWHHCPWTHLPSSFRPQKLLILDMQFSNFRKLWKGALPLVNLRSINVSWSKHLKTIPNFDKVKRLEKLSLRCCENLLKFNKSLLQLSKLSHLELGECQSLKQLPERIGQLDGLRNLDLGGCHILKGLPDSVGQLTWLSELCLGECYNLIQLPESVGQMKGLKRLDARGTNIEQLPDSICQLSHLDVLDLEECKKLRTLPEQIGNMKSLRMFDASGSAIRQLPDSFEDLINLGHLYLGDCRNLERLPGQLGKMKCLQTLSAYNTAIEEVPDSIAQLTRLERLDLIGCQKFGEIPSGIWSLTSIGSLRLENRKSLESFPNSVKDMKGLEHLRVRCNIRSCLPKILCLTSLRRLRLRDTGESFSSSTKPFSLSNLSNLLVLKLEDCRSLGSCLPELPLNLKELHVERYESLEELPDLSTFLNLKTLWISECKNLQSLPPLPPHLYTLEIHDCRSLRDTHDHLTTLKVLDDLKITKCNDLIFNAEKSFFEVLEVSDFDFVAVVTRTEIPDWFSYKKSGSKVNAVVPEILSPNKSLYALLWVVYKCTSYDTYRITPIIVNNNNNNNNNNNKTGGYTGHGNDRGCYLYWGGVGSAIYCVRLNETYSSRDTLTVSFDVSKFSNGRYVKVSDRRIKLEKCGIHLLYK